MVASTPAAAGGMTGLGSAEPVPVAILARTSTLGLQDPVTSVRRQIRSCTAWLPAGWFVAGVYSDVESGATDLEARSRTDSWKVLSAAGLSRDGGMADLLVEAGPAGLPVRRGRLRGHRTIGAGHLQRAQLERQSQEYGIPLFATDEPADIAGVNSTTVLVRRVRQGVAEWYRLKLRGSTWKGFVEHNAEGRTSAPPLRVRR